MVHARVCVVGLWHLGCVYATCLAQLGHHVVATDENIKTVRELARGRPPIFEPGLADAIAGALSHGNLSFVENIEEAVKDADFVVVAYDTPVDTQDKADLSIVLRAAEHLRDVAHHATIVISSQVPVGTSEQIASMLSDGGSAPKVAYVPENLRLGQAIERFMKPDMIVIGANSPSAMAKVRMLFSPIKTKIIEMDLRSAELTKHALNAFLAASISFANEIGNICDLVGADGLKVAEALRSDSRIGPRALLRPGLGFAGGTLARDLRILQETGRRHAYETPFIDAVVEVNNRQNASIVYRLKRLIGELDGKHIGVLGLTYKAGTSTLRRSAALEIIGSLRQEGASVRAFDPRVSKTDLSAEKFLLCDDPYAASENADALVILNDWSDFLKLDFKRIRNLMKEPVVFDTQNLLDPDMMRECGVRYIGIGRGHL